MIGNLQSYSYQSIIIGCLFVKARTCLAAPRRRLHLTHELLGITLYARSMYVFAHEITYQQKRNRKLLE